VTSERAAKRSTHAGGLEPTLELGRLDADPVRLLGRRDPQSWRIEVFDRPGVGELYG